MSQAKQGNDKTKQNKKTGRWSPGDQDLGCLRRCFFNLPLWAPGFLPLLPWSLTVNAQVLDLASLQKVPEARLHALQLRGRGFSLLPITEVP
jgi:hypothetical protein